MYQSVHFHHIHEYLCPGCDHICGIEYPLRHPRFTETQELDCRMSLLEIQDSQCWMRLERIANGAPRLLLTSTWQGNARLIQPDLVLGEHP
jgi:hypothetical protein